MAQKYLDKLEKIMKGVGVDGVECKHFFSGAACYANGKIFATLTPVGFALKLPEKTRDKLMEERAKPLQYFPNSPIKKDYVVLTKGMIGDTKRLRQLVRESIHLMENA